VRPEPGARAAAASPSADRERVIDLLKAAFVQGRLTRDEFDARVGLVLAARTRAELTAVTADLPADLIGAPPRTKTRNRLSMNSAVTAGAVVIVVANAGMLAALSLGSAVGVAVVAVFIVIGTVLAIGAMIVAP
jgi:DUF1707 SHOCT-like domain